MPNWPSSMTYDLHGDSVFDYIVYSMLQSNGVRVSRKITVISVYTIYANLARCVLI